MRASLRAAGHAARRSSSSRGGHSVGGRSGRAEGVGMAHVRRVLTLEPERRDDLWVSRGERTILVLTRARPLAPRDSYPYHTHIIPTQRARVTASGQAEDVYRSSQSDSTPCFSRSRRAPACLPVDQTCSIHINENVRPSSPSRPTPQLNDL